MPDRRQILQELLDEVKAEKAAFISESDKKIALYSEALALETLEARAPTTAASTKDNRKRRLGELTYFERVADAFVARGNKPASVQQIAEEIGSQAHSVTNVVYTTHKNSFVVHEVEGYIRRKEWSLSPDVYAARKNTK